MVDKIWISVKNLEKVPFSGNHKGMRYYVQREKETIHAYVFPMPLCFAKTPDEKKMHRDFPASEEELPHILEWIKEQYTVNPDKWKNDGIL